MKTKSVLVLVGSDFEEIELITPVDLLRRAGVTVTLASCEQQLAVKGANGVTLMTDCLLGDVEDEDFDCLVLPGGPGVRMLRQKAFVINRIQKQAQSGGWIAAICAAPLLLKDAGVLVSPYTAHFSTATQLPAIDFSKPVVQNNKIITSQGPGTAFTFALAIIEHLVGAQKSDDIRKGTVFTPCA